MNEIVSIKHDCGTGKRIYDGSGVLMKMINQTVLVTCRHVLSGQSGCKHFFSYNGVEHEIDMARTSKRYFCSSDIQPMPIRVEGEYTARLDDYAFYEVDFELNHELMIAKSTSILMSDELILVTHEPKPPGKKITLPTKRLNFVVKSMENTIRTRTQVGRTLCEIRYCNQHFFPPWAHGKHIMSSITVVGERLSNKCCIPVKHKKYENDCQNRVY